MSRSGYSDYCEGWELIRWRGAVASAIRGKRGQAFLREMLTAMDALPEKKLVAHDLETPTTGMPFRLEGGDVCAIGSVGKARGIDMSRIDPYDRDSVAGVFGIPLALAAEIMFENDEGAFFGESDEARFTRMRRWAESKLIEWQEPSTPLPDPAERVSGKATGE